MKASYGSSLRRVVAGLLTIAVAGIVVACSDATSPTELRPNVAAPSNSLLGSLLERLNLLSCRALPEYTDTETIGPAGGVMNIGPHVFRVPPGALTSPVTITATAPSVTWREVRFQPHGLQFEEPANLTIDYSGCSLVSRLLPKRIGYAYNPLNPLYLIPSLDIPFLQKVTGRIEHFSGYIVYY